MSAQHTQGRLHVAGQDKVQIRSDKHQIAKAWSFAGKTGQENARRLVACWNACEGISTDFLENIAMTGDTLASRFKARDDTERELAAQRDELLEALRIAREHIQIDRNSFKEAHSFPDGFMEREDQSTLKLLDQKLAVIDAAIAKAEAP